MTGLYVHIPFCRSKCPYCDFYSITDTSLCDKYVCEILRRLDKYRELKFSSLYFGGGTPSLIGEKRIAHIIGKARELLTCDAEITVECNPSSVTGDFFKGLSYSGVNRISLGLQSVVDSERRALGRLCGREAVEGALKQAKNAGITNISLDLMLGVPRQTRESLRESIDFCVSSGIPHVSAYMLKIEPGTRFYKNYDKLELPCEDEVCDMYLETVSRLSSGGLQQYEISNFSVPGFEGKHNLNYWDCGKYLGLGAAAHSFLDGKRFYFERDINSFIEGGEPVSDGTGGDYEEYSMLRLRLTQGIKNDLSLSRFGCKIPDFYYKNAEKYVKNNLAVADSEGIRLTPEGFLVSNTIIADILCER